MLPFDDANEYELVQVNQDGAVLKTLDFAQSVVHATFSIHDATNYPAYVADAGLPLRTASSRRATRPTTRRCRTRSRR